MRGEMSRSMRGEGTWDMESRGEPWSGECIERPGMMRLTDPGGTCDIAITSCLGCDRWWWSASSPDIYMWTVISLAPGPHITGHKDIDPGQAGTDVRYWFPGSVCGASQLCVCCCVSSGVCLPVVTLSYPQTRVNARSPTFWAREGWIRH